MPTTTARLAERFRRLPPVVVDAALAVVVGVVTVTSVAVTDADEGGERMTWWGWALIAVQLVPLVWRRRAPMVVAAVTGAATLAFGMANLPDPAIQFPLVLALYSAAAYRPRIMTVPAVLSVILVATGVAFLIDEQADLADLAVNYLVGIGSWVVGDSTRAQRERAVWLAERQHEEARRATAEERVRIARDLHDVVAHHISVIVVQAEAAQEVLAASPERAERAMGAVADTARTALGELRRMLGLLRADAGLAPQPGLAGLTDLVASVDGAGLTVELRTAGPERAVDGIVGLTAYRIVQEALTNVLRHADADRACVEVRFEPDVLAVRVTDDGRGPGATGGATDTGGQGLVGMRERVALVGGRLETGPGSDGGFVVEARLPLPSSP